LSEREAQLALRNELENGNLDVDNDFIDNEDFEWNSGKLLTFPDSIPTESFFCRNKKELKELDTRKRDE